MGIRFLCPNGHRLNVKSFLAGKRGICPHCGEGVDIPLESQLAPRKKKRKAEQNGSERGDVHAATIADDLPPDAVSDDDGDDAAQTIPTVSPSQPLMLEKQPTPSDSATLTPETDQPPAFVPAADPIDDLPAAVWYVRPPSGGQFGPAVGEVMRKWIDEGRVSADSLVWREGWDEWETAESVFPTLQKPAAAAKPAMMAKPAIAPASPAPQPAVDAPSRPLSTHSPYRKPPGGGNSMRLAIVAMLGVVSLALLILLVYVIVNRSKPTPETPPAQAAVWRHINDGQAATVDRYEPALKSLV